LFSTAFAYVIYLMEILIPRYLSKRNTLHMLSSSKKLFLFISFSLLPLYGTITLILYHWFFCQFHIGTSNNCNHMEIYSNNQNEIEGTSTTFTFLVDESYKHWIRNLEPLQETFSIFCSILAFDSFFFWEYYIIEKLIF